jgi:hypothetical protein
MAVMIFDSRKNNSFRIWVLWLACVWKLQTRITGYHRASGVLWRLGSGKGLIKWSNGDPGTEAPMPQWGYRASTGKCEYESSFLWCNDDPGTEALMPQWGYRASTGKCEYESSFLWCNDDPGTEAHMPQWGYRASTGKCEFESSFLWFLWLTVYSASTG